MMVMVMERCLAVAPWAVLCCITAPLVPIGLPVAVPCMAHLLVFALPYRPLFFSCFYLLLKQRCHGTCFQFMRFFLSRHTHSQQILYVEPRHHGTQD